MRLNGLTFVTIQGVSRRIGNRVGSGTILSMYGVPGACLFVELTHLFRVTLLFCLSNFQWFRLLSPVKCLRKQRKCGEKYLPRRILDLRMSVPLDMVA